MGNESVRIGLHRLTSSRCVYTVLSWAMKVCALVCTV